MSSLKQNGECKLGDAYKNLVRTSTFFGRGTLGLAVSGLGGWGERFKGRKRDCDDESSALKPRKSPLEPGANSF